MTAVRITELKLAEIEATHAVLQWQTNVPAGARVEYTPVLCYSDPPSRDRDQIVQGPDLVYQRALTIAPQALRHEIRIEALVPGRGYYVRVQSHTGSQSSAWRELAFTTRVPVAEIARSGIPLKDALLQHAQALGEKQKEARRQIWSLSDLRAYQAQLRSRFVQLLGGLPDKSPLNARVVSRIDRGDFWIENIVYESLPGFFVPGNLYLPKVQHGPVPGILGVCGHGIAGKSDRQLHQMVNVNLVRKGYVLFQIDPPGQNEMGWDGTRWSFADIHYNGTGYAHSLMALSALLVGQSLTRYFLWDGIRAIDYLTSRQEVDANRIGVWGCSGGGGQSSYIAALDERVKVAVPMSMLYDTVATMQGPYPGFNSRGGESFLTEETYPITALSEGLSYTSLLSLIAPRSLVIARATQDAQPLWTTQLIYEELKGIYDRVGAADRLALATVEGFHCQDAMRQFVYWAFDREFGKRGLGMAEAHRDLLPSSLGSDGIRQATPLDVAPHSSMVQDFGSATVHTKVVEAAAALAQKRPTPAACGGWAQYAQHVRHRIHDCLGLTPRPSPLIVEASRDDRRGHLIGRMRFVSALEVPVQMQICQPSKPTRCIPILYLCDQVPAGGDLLENVEAVSEWVSRGHVVCTLKVRGLNEVAPLEDRIEFGISTYHTRRVHDALAIGRPLLGQRVTDVLMAIDVLVEALEIDQVVIVGDAAGGLWGIFAAALDSRIASLAVRRCLSTYQRVIDSACPTWVQNDRESSIAIPGVLKYFDLPALVSLLAPRPVRLSNLVDGANCVLTASQVKDDYRQACERYATLNVEDRIQIADDDCLDPWLLHHSGYPKEKV